MNRCRLVVIALIAFALSAAPRATHAGPLGLGPRIGFSNHTDQGILGVGLVQPIAKNIEVAPSLDFGWADHGFSTSVNGDLRYTLAPESKLKPYVGAGLTWFNFNPDGDGDTSSDIGGNLLGGVWFNKGHWPELNLEAKAGLGNVPDFTMILGFKLL